MALRLARLAAAATLVACLSAVGVAVRALAGPEAVAQPRALAAAGPPGGAYISTEDEEVAKLAADAAVEYCVGGKGLDSAEVGDGQQDLLDAVGGENVIFEILKSAESPSELLDEVKAQLLKPRWIIERTVPLIAAIAVLVMWLCCCWTVCPCCRCCRCCSKERRSVASAKCVVFFVLCGCFGGVVFGLTRTIAGYRNARDGFEAMTCSAAEALNTTFSGQEHPRFIGMLPVLKTFKRLDKELDDNSGFLADIANVMQETTPIEAAVALANSTIGLLGAVLKLPENVRPKSASGEDLNHTCKMCEQLGPVLQNMNQALNDGVGAALSSARGEVQKQLDRQERATLQTRLREGTQALVEIKDGMRTAVAPFVEPDAFGQVQHHLDTTIFYLVNVFCALAVVLILSSCLSTCCWAVREKDRGGARYARTPHRCACCTMCFAVPCFVLPVLVLGGLLRVASVPVAGVCLTLSGMDRQVFLDVAPALGVQDMDGDRGAMLADFVEQCIANPNHTANPNLMDMVFRRNEAGSKEYLRQELMASVTEPLDAAFEDIKEKIDSAKGASILNNSDVKDLLARLRSTPIDAMIIPDVPNMRDDPRLLPMWSYEPLRVGLATSLACDNVTITAPDGSSQVIPGIRNFAEVLASTVGASITERASCIPNVDCAAVQQEPEREACEAGQVYLDIKRTLTQADPELFRCDLFEAADGAPCDPKDMRKDQGKWVDDCLIQDGSKAVTKVMKVTCNLAGFVEYVQGYQARMEKVFERLEDATAEVTTNITVSMRDLIDDYVVFPIQDIVDGVTCGFVQPAYERFVNGFCYQGVIGFRTIGASYIVFAGSVLVMVLAMYFLWRIAVDNVYAASDREAFQNAL